MTLDDTKTKARATYNAAADSYDDPANSFWERFGLRTVERLNLQHGARVLDVCCESGASAIPAAKIVGPTRSVLGVDLARGNVIAQNLLLGAIFVGLALITDSLYALLASSLAERLKGNQRSQTGGRYFAGLVYVGLGITTALTGSRK